MICKTFFATLFVLLTTISFADEINLSQNENDLVETIINNRMTCVKAFGENKIYLRNDKIYREEKEIFLILNDQGDYITLPKLHSDEYGYFISYPVHVIIGIDSNPKITLYGNPRVGVQGTIDKDGNTTITGKAEWEKTTESGNDVKGGVEGEVTRDHEGKVSGEVSIHIKITPSS